jgi:hypothetical protein
MIFLLCHPSNKLNYKNTIVLLVPQFKLHLKILNSFINRKENILIYILDLTLNRVNNKFNFKFLLV